MNRQKEDAWREAKRRCHLTEEEVRMAKELGFQPKSLIKNIPSPSQKWKAQVNDWVRSQYEKKIGSRKPPDAPPPAVPAASVPQPGEERRNAEQPWPDKPEIIELPPLDLDYEFRDEEFPNDDFCSFEPPDGGIEEQNGLMLRRQQLFRWSAQAIAVAMSELPEVEKVAAFGAASQPLKMEVPRFHEFRRQRIKILHKCAGLDLAVWLNDFSQLQILKKTMARALALTQDTAYGGVAHHQVDVHVFDSSSGEYRGGLCIFGQCPKAGKRECRVPGCGAQPFLQQIAGYRFRPAIFTAAPKVILFDRTAGFLVPLPQIDAKPREVRWTPRESGDGGFMDEDLPF
jgi:hypothetical protein